MMNKYNRIARIYPALLTAVPIFALNYFLLQKYIDGFTGSLGSITLVGGTISFSVALTFFFAQAGRFIGKEYFEKKYFCDELKMPTTNHLLHSDITYSSQHTQNIHNKILQDFSVTLLTVEEESRDEKAARKRIVEAVSMIRSKTRDKQLILQHNIEYGFVRNLIGGSVIGATVSIINIVIFGFIFINPLAFWICWSLSLLYLIIILLSRHLIHGYGVHYAKILIQEYLLIK